MMTSPKATFWGYADFFYQKSDNIFEFSGHFTIRLGILQKNTLKTAHGLDDFSFSL